MRPQLVHFVLNEIQFLLVQADFLADGSCAVWHIETLLSQYNGHFFSKLGSDEKKILKTRALAIRCPSLYNGHFFVETQVSKQKIFKKYAPLLLRKRERVVSADMRFERVASTAGVYTHGDFRLRKPST